MSSTRTAIVALDDALQKIKKAEGDGKARSALYGLLISELLAERNPMVAYCNFTCEFSMAFRSSASLMEFDSFMKQKGER